LYESLIATRGRGEPKSTDFEESKGTNVQPYHRQSAAWSSKDEQRLQLKSGAEYDPDDIFYTRPSNSNVRSRSSRVSSTGDQVFERHPRTREYQYPPLQRLGRGEGEVIARVHQENYSEKPQSNSQSQFRNQGRNTQTHTGSGLPAVDHGVTAESNHGETATAFAESRTYKGGFSTRQPTGDSRSIRNRGGRPNKIEEERGASDEFSFVKAEVFTEGPKTYAAHYVADVSNYTMAHRHYDGNGRLRNADGIFEAWKPSDWMTANDGSKEAFSLASSGTLTVKKDGIYYIYAQIHYLDVHDINGFLVQINSEPFLQCTTMTETHGSSSSKSNTCFTGGITHLKENDRILIKDIETNRYSIFRPEKSFFGLMRIGNASGR
jgi:eiger protein